MSAKFSALWLLVALFALCDAAKHRPQERPPSFYQQKRPSRNEVVNRIHKEPVLHLKTTSDWERLQRNHAYVVVVHDGDRCDHEPSTCAAVSREVQHLANEFPDLSFAMVVHSELRSEAQKKLRYRRQRRMGSKLETEDADTSDDKFSHLSAAEKQERKQETQDDEKLMNDDEIWLARQFVTLYCPDVELPTVLLLHDKVARPSVVLDPTATHLKQWKSIIEKERHSLDLYQEKRWKRNTKKNSPPSHPSRDRDEL